MADNLPAAEDRVLTDFGLVEPAMARVLEKLTPDESAAVWRWGGERAGLVQPGAWLTRDLLMRAVDLRAIAWNALCAAPTAGGSWPRFWRKLHELREAVNRPEHEDIRLAYAGTFDPRPHLERAPHRVIDEHWRIVAPDERGG